MYFQVAGEVSVVDTEVTSVAGVAADSEEDGGEHGCLF